VKGFASVFFGNFIVCSKKTSNFVSSLFIRVIVVSYIEVVDDNVGYAFGHPIPRLVQRYFCAIHFVAVPVM